MPPKKYSENHCRDCDYLNPKDVKRCNKGLRTHLEQIPVMPSYAQFGCRYFYSKRNIYKGKKS